MRYYNTILFSVLVIAWFPQNSESISWKACHKFFINFKETQVHIWERILCLFRDHHRGEMSYHSNIESTPQQRIGISGSLFIEATKLCSENGHFFPTAYETKLREICPFLERIICDKRAIYRTFDGSCNNLKQPYWGKANTPFRRLQAAEYANCVDQPRYESVDGGPLPEPRQISVGFHRICDLGVDDMKLTHLTMTFGQFLNHEMGSTVHHDNMGIDCCKPSPFDPCVKNDFFDRCIPMAVPPNDPYFSKYRRTCLPFTRALPTPNLHCTFGPKEQLNAQTSYIDCSQVYGTSLEESNGLRTMTGGLLKITPTEDLDLMLHGTTFCTTPNNYCFVAGDFRVNQNFMLLTLHTVFLREHNRIAGLLARADPSLDDETLFQKARQILIAQMQHITYNEYLPLIIGKSQMKIFGLDPLSEGYTRYEPKTQASLSNAHIGAAFRFGHSTIRKTFSNGRGNQIFLSPTLGLTDPFYQPGDAASGFATGMVNDLSQETDRLITDQVADKLFERVPGQGNDLASTNIQRGRDIGLRPYTKWRSWCGLGVTDDFDSLTGHTTENLNLLRTIYQNASDIDLWTGGLSEIHLDGANVGPTFACILAEQFKAIKYGDRFWYEHKGSGPTQLTPSQLSSIRKTSLSRILCDNTHINRIQKNPFLRTEDPINDLVDCDSLDALDIRPFVRRCGPMHQELPNPYKKLRQPSKGSMRMRDRPDLDRKRFLQK